MTTVKSIEVIEKHNIIETACNPVLILCDDLNFYYCKYNSGFSRADRLAREYLSACFLKEWKLAVPDFSFVKILKEHISPDLGVPYAYFEARCFGSRKCENATEVNRFLDEVNPYQKSKFSDAYDYLRIALFDLWIANDDRNHNNYNLLILAEKGRYKFSPIDHEKVFNTGNLERPLYTISEDSSLLTAPICLRLFTAKELSNKIRIDEFKDYFYLCILRCKRKLTQILAAIPEDWKIDSEELIARLNSHLFEKEWIDECWKTFVQYLQFTVNKLTNIRNNGNSL